MVRVCLVMARVGQVRVCMDLSQCRMEAWGLGPQDCEAINSELVYTRVSGYGQSGPLSSKPGFASACEAMGGLRYAIQRKSTEINGIWLWLKVCEWVRGRGIGEA